MVTGDITATQEGVYNISAAALIAKLSTLNVGASMAGIETKTIHIIPHGNTGDVSIITLARAA